MKGKIAFLGLALILLVMQPAFAQEPQQEPQQEVLIDVATEVANLLRSEEVTGFTENMRAGFATAFADLSTSLQARAYDQAIAYSNKVIDTFDKLMDDPALAPLKSSDFGVALFELLRSLPDMIFTSLKDPLEFGVIESFISVAVLFNNLVASIISMGFLANLFAVIESSPGLVARLPQLLVPVYELPFEFIPVLIESVVPILLTAVFLVFYDATGMVGQILSLDAATWSNTIMVPFNAGMDILSVWRDTAFNILGGTLSVIANGVSLFVSSPRVILGLLIAGGLAFIPIFIDFAVACVEYGLIGISLSCVLSVIIGVANLFALFIAGTALNPVFLASSFAEGALGTVSEWVITLLDLLDLQSLRNGAEVLSEGMANLL
ncbi:MAG: hypothetical protein SVE93_07090 [Candidatus Thermoplasmatota archaeon]|nr:hypothetical protein [Candidatus Thermoplasmatota archaeon]